jgi:hypothetical protein
MHVLGVAAGVSLALAGCAFNGLDDGADDAADDTADDAPPGDDEPDPPRFASCADALAAGETDDGLYEIDPDDGEPAFTAYCEQHTAGGGWMLALKASGLAATFRYDASAWTSATTLAGSLPDHDYIEAKLDAFVRLPAREVLIEADYGAVETTSLALALAGARTLRERFADGEPDLFAGDPAWHALVPADIPGCAQQAGINVGDSRYRARLGVAARDYDWDGGGGGGGTAGPSDCETRYDAVIGVGLHVDDEDDYDCDAAPTAGYAAHCRATAAFIWLYVR